MFMQPASKMHAVQREGECNHILNPSASGRLWVRPPVRRRLARQGNEGKDSVSGPCPRSAGLGGMGAVKYNQFFP